jgi:Flp pilus assembly protein TadG
MSDISAPKPKLRYSEQGMIAIMTTMVLMVVISLIVLGFAQVSRRNQRESIDRQLSTQAFYAAETGVNDTRKLIQDAVAGGTTTIPEKTGCTDTASGFYSLTPVIDAARNVKYSCLLVDPSPTSLDYGNIGTTSTVIPIATKSGAALNSLRFEWKAKDSEAAGWPLSGCPTGWNDVFSPAASWTCGYGVLRFDIVPTEGSGLNIAGLQNSTMTTFVIPQSSGAAVLTCPTYATPCIGYLGGASNTRNRVGVICTATSCRLQVTGLTQNSYYIRVSSVYRDVSLNVCAVSTSNTCMEVTGSQVVIDSTGKAGDVLRRIQVRVPLKSDSTNQLSDYAIQSADSICKRYSVMTGLLSRDSLGVNGTSRLCGTGPL